MICPIFRTSQRTEQNVRRAVVYLSVFCLFAAGSLLPAQNTADDPTDSGLTEQVKVKLITVNTVVIDGKGNSVPDLTKDDFTVELDGAPVDIDTFDANCPIGAVGDPINLRKEMKTEKFQKIGPDVKRRIVLVFDYYFMDIPLRGQVLDFARSMLQVAKGDAEEIMIVALAYGVRVEQKFTTDTRLLDAALQRMEHDSTLWARQFKLGSSGREYFDDLITLMDVLSGYPGQKGVVLFSSLTTMGTVNVTNWYNAVAMHAMAAQSPIYPAFTLGLQAGGSSMVSETLSRFANQSGGRMPYYTSDLSMSYRRAQRDLSCFYTIGVYADEDYGPKRRSIRVHAKGSGHEVRYPEMFRLFTDEEVQENRERAAFIDPGPYEHQLVRLQVWPAHPTSTTSWDTLVMLDFPVPVGKDGATVSLEGALRKRDTGTQIDKYKNQFTVDPPADGSDHVPVTVFGDSKVKSGEYTLTAVLSQPGGRDVFSASADFTVPEAPSDILIMRGPLLARVVPGGKLIRADKNDKPNDTRLDKVLGDGNSFEPLVVHEVHQDDDTIIYWNACVFGKSQLSSDAVVQRTILDKDGNKVLALDPIPLNLQSIGKNLVCHDQLDKLAAGSLPVGEYKLDVAITYANSGDLVGYGSAPLAVLE
jgi:VWFA-related protein